MDKIFDDTSPTHIGSSISDVASDPPPRSSEPGGVVSKIRRMFTASSPEEYPEIVFKIGLCVTAIGLVFTLLKYSKEGDISTFKNRSRLDRESMKKKYDTKDKIVSRLRDLVTFRHSYVKWNRLMIIALAASVLICGWMSKRSKRLSAVDIVVASAIVFLAIDLPNRWGDAHVSRGVIQEANMLYAMFDDRDPDPEREPNAPEQESEQ